MSWLNHAPFDLVFKVLAPFTTINEIFHSKKKKKKKKKAETAQLYLYSQHSHKKQQQQKKKEKKKLLGNNIAFFSEI